MDNFGYLNSSPYVPTPPPLHTSKYAFSWTTPLTFERRYFMDDLLVKNTVPTLNKNFGKKIFMKILKRDWVIHVTLLTITSVSFFYWRKKVFTHVNIWMIGKKLIKLYYQKKDFYSHLNMKYITYADYMHAKRFSKDFEIKNSGDYHDLFVQGNTLLLADVFENFQNTCLEIHELDPARFLIAPGLAWQAALKKTKTKLDLLTDGNILLMVEKGIRGGICHAIYRYVQANNTYMTDHDKNKELTYLKYLNVNSLFEWEIPQNFLVNGFKWIENTSQFYKNFMKSYNEDSGEGDFLEVNVHDLFNNLLFLRERMKIEKIEKLVAQLHD